MKTILWKRYALAYCFLLPSLIGLAVFTIYPIVASFILSFTQWDTLTPIQFVGFDNYKALLRDETFRISLVNNLFYTGVTVPLTIFFSILLAIGMNTKIRGVGIFRVLYFLPNVTASIAVGVIWALMFTPYGPINGLIRMFGVDNPPGWLASPAWALPAVMIVAIWKGVGYNAVILLAGLQGIPNHLYEAAEIDGAGRLMKFMRITIPMLSPVIFFCSVMAVIGSFQVFDTIMAMTQGGPGRATNVIVYHIYNTAFLEYKFGYASAMSYVLFLLIMLVTLIQFKGQKHWVNY